MNTNAENIPTIRQVLWVCVSHVDFVELFRWRFGAIVASFARMMTGAKQSAIEEEENKNWKYYVWQRMGLFAALCSS